MREHRWETPSALTFEEVLHITQRLKSAGLSPAYPEKDVIAYIEEWGIANPQGIHALALWPLEDITLIHIFENWTGDFFLLSGQYHTVVQQYQSVNTYCSLCHPWLIGEHMVTLLPEGMFWLGFRHAHSFIRIRVHTSEIVAPGETWADHQRPMWLTERQSAFLSAIRTLDLPLEPIIDQTQVRVQTPRQETPLFCSWPDAFGPCQIELNSPDVFEFMVPASQLASTYLGQKATVRAYLTGFTEKQLLHFDSFDIPKRSVCRCSIHCVMKELPEILTVIGQTGRLYSTLCEFQTSSIIPYGHDSAAIIGIVANQGQFHIEVRLNRYPMNQQETTEWLADLIDKPVVYAPLPAFP